ncbi:MAG: aspartate aminotransferase family protein, partial [Bacteroidota bacterium]
HLPEVKEQSERNRINQTFLNDINASGRAYLSHTRINGEFTLRFVVAQTRVTREHVFKAWERIEKISDKYV